jgi:hypothetical protein
MNIHKHERTTVINKNIVENDTCNRMPIESKMRKNNNHNIESNISNSNQNIISNIGKKKKRMFWSTELNEVLTILLSQCTTNNEIASRFLSQKSELNLIFDQVIRHIRKLKLGQINNKSNTIQEDAHIQNKSNLIQEDAQIQNKSNLIQDDAQIKNKCNTILDECGTIKEDTKVVHNEVQNKRDIVFSNKKRPYTKWKEMDESLWFVLNEDNGSTMLSKANLFVEKNPKI